MKPQDNYPVLFFDGVCHLCNYFIRLVLKHDKNKRFRFATLQSDAGLAVAKSIKTAGNTAGTVILRYNNRYYTRSSAALKTAQLLGGAWQILYVFILVPAFIRNAIYDFVARHRYKWFGKSDQCMLPTPEIEERFIN